MPKKEITSSKKRAKQKRRKLMEVENSGELGELIMNRNYSSKMFLEKLIIFLLKKGYNIPNKVLSDLTSFSEPYMDLIRYFLIRIYIILQITGFPPDKIYEIIWSCIPKFGEGIHAIYNVDAYGPTEPPVANTVEPGGYFRFGNRFGPGEAGVDPEPKGGTKKKSNKRKRRTKRR